MRIHHVALRTDDLERLERFYAGTLGLVVTRRQDARSVWLDAGGTILMLERREPGEPAVDPRSMEMFAFTVEPARAHALGAAVAIEGRTASTLYVRDPDGRRVGLSSWPDALT